MLTITATANLLGVTISGDMDDLRELVDAFHDITAHEEDKDYAQFANISIRVLGVCYDIRHASMGDRDIHLLDNGMNRDLMKFHGVVASEKNVIYSCNILMPEMYFAMLALNKLVLRRVSMLTKQRTAEYHLVDAPAIWDQTIAVIRRFQAKYADCMKNVLGSNRFSRWRKLLVEGSGLMNGMMPQYLDVLNIDYIEWSREKRDKQLGKLAERIAQYYSDPDHAEINREIKEAARRLDVEPSELSLTGFEYPDDEELIW